MEICKPESFKEIFEQIELEQIEDEITMDAKDLYLYKVCSKHSPIELYVAAENQYEAALKAKDNEVFKDEDPSQMSIKYVDMVTV